jgi:hypothetical protein
MVIIDSEVSGKALAIASLSRLSTSSPPKGIDLILSGWEISLNHAKIRRPAPMSTKRELLTGPDNQRRRA